jgi:methionine synthase II (cobalamin-independent)
VAAASDGADPSLDPLYEAAIRDTIREFEATGSPVITDGEQRKHHNFWTYCVHGLPNTAPDGFRIPFAAGHTRRMPQLFVGVVDPTDPRVETPEEIRDRVLEAARHIPVDQLGTCDDCGFSPFCDDTTTTRETAFAKIRNRVLGTSLAADVIGGV